MSTLTAEEVELNEWLKHTLCNLCHRNLFWLAFAYYQTDGTEERKTGYCKGCRQSSRRVGGLGDAPYWPSMQDVAPMEWNH